MIIIIPLVLFTAITLTTSSSNIPFSAIISGSFVTVASIIGSESKIIIIYNVIKIIKGTAQPLMTKAESVTETIVDN